jgi:hypothetical protein
MARMTMIEPGDGPRRPQLDRPPGDRYLRPEPPGGGAGAADGRLAAVWPPLAVVLGTAIAYTLVGGLMSATAGLIILALFAGWLVGKLVSPPPLAAAIGLVAIVAGLAGIWLFGRLEGGVLDPIAYFDEVQGWPLVALQLLAGGGMAAASSR